MRTITVNQICGDTYDVVLPEGVIWLTIFRRFDSLQEIAEYITGKGLRFDEIIVNYRGGGTQVI